MDIGSRCPSEVAFVLANCFAPGGATSNHGRSTWSTPNSTDMRMDRRLPPQHCSAEEHPAVDEKASRVVGGGYPLSVLHGADPRRREASDRI